jgi:hypothetical protein
MMVEEEKVIAEFFANLKEETKEHINESDARRFESSFFHLHFPFSVFFEQENGI